MNTAAVEKIADAVLYEGYILYPYRPSSVKNRQRFNFGVLYPREYCDSQPGSESWEMRTECLIAGPGSASIEVKVRFLQMSSRLQSGQVWQEGQERDVQHPRNLWKALTAKRITRRLCFPVSKVSFSSLRVRLTKICIGYRSAR